MTKQTVTINGIDYDAHTGLRLDEAPKKPHTEVAASRALHKKASRTRTLSRAHVKKPAKPSIASPRKVIAVDGITRSPQIRKFAVEAEPAKPTNDDIAPTVHPMVVSAAAKQPAHPAAVVAPPAPKPRPAKEIKHQAIQKAMKNAKPTKTKKKSIFKRPRFLSIASASLAIMLLAGYFTYINLPNISVRVAAVQAGVAATYPSYRPAGYSLKGPVAYSSGQVGMQFASNTSSESFKLTQVKSTWDSSALLTNYVEQASSGDYSTYTDDGITIYTYGTNAAWVNGGILHTISGNAPLTSDQVQKIAVSM